MPGMGKLRLARSFYAASGHLQKYKPCSLDLSVEMAWAAKRLADKPLTGLFSGSLTAQFYLLFLIEPLPIFEILFNFHFSVKCSLTFIKEWALGKPSFIFGKSFRVGYRYWARGFGLWAVWVAKNSACAISTILPC